MCKFQYNVDRLDTQVKAEASFKVKGGLRAPQANQESPDLFRSSELVCCRKGEAIHPVYQFKW